MCTLHKSTTDLGVTFISGFTIDGTDAWISGNALWKCGFSGGTQAHACLQTSSMTTPIFLVAHLDVSSLLSLASVCCFCDGWVMGL